MTKILLLPQNILNVAFYLLNKLIFALTPFSFILCNIPLYLNIISYISLIFDTIPMPLSFHFFKKSSKTQYNETELLKMLKDASQRELAFRQLYPQVLEVVQKWVHSKEYSFLAKEEREEKAVHLVGLGYEIFIRNVENDTFQGLSSLKTYWVRICQLIEKEEVRKAGKIAKFEQRSENEELIDKQVENEVLISMLLEEDKSLITNALLSVEARCQQVLTHRFFFQWEWNDIATELQFPSRAAAQMKADQCIKKLRDWFKERNLLTI